MSVRITRYAGRILLLTLAVLILGLVPSASASVGVGRLSLGLVDLAHFPTVDLYLSVADLDGRPLLDLSETDFTLYEANVLVPDFDLEPVEQPLLISIVIDSAISFNVWEGGAPRIAHANEAARWLVAPAYGRLTLDDEVGIFAFRDGQPVRVVDFTYDHQRVLDQGINKVSTAGNRYTAVFDLLRQSISEMIAREGPYRRALVVFTDGVDLNSFSDADQVIQDARDANLLIYPVGLGPNLVPDSTDPRVIGMQRLARETGGQYLWYRPGRAGQEEAMQALLDSLIAQRQGYRLSYASNQYRGSHEVHLAVARGGYSAEDVASFQVPPMPPALTLDHLDDRQVLEGKITVQPSISRAQRDIERVEYWIDGELVHTARAAPWTFEWDTAQYASSALDPDELALQVVACDIGAQCTETRLTLGVLLPLPTPTPAQAPTPIPQAASPPASGTTGTIQVATSIAALLIALIALLSIIVLLKRGSLGAVQDVAANVRRKTRVWRQRTGVFGAVDSRPGRATLTVVSDPFRGQQFRLEETVIFVGREEERADVVLYWDDYISRRHAKIAHEEDRFYIWDLNSANGTWVNQQRVPRSLSEGVDISEAVSLHDGTIIRLGPDLRLSFGVSDGTGPDGATSARPGEINASDHAEASTQVFSRRAISEAASDKSGAADA